MLGAAERAPRHLRLLRRFRALAAMAVLGLACCCCYHHAEVELA